MIDKFAEFWNGLSKTAKVVVSVLFVVFEYLVARGQHGFNVLVALIIGAIMYGFILFVLKKVIDSIRK